MNKRYLFVSTELNVMRWTNSLVRKKGICLEEFEVEALKMIYIHKIVSATMMHEIYLHYRPNTHKNAVSNRLARLVQKKILFKRKHPSLYHSTSISYFYTLGEIGFKVLKALNLPDLQITQRSYDPSKIRIPSTHNFYAIETIHRLFIRNQQRIEPYPFRIMRGDVHELFSKTNITAFSEEKVKNGYNRIIPDYVITKGNLIICLESDMGTEKSRQIQQKETMYCHLMKNEAFQDKRLYVVYSVIDEKRSGNANENNLSKGRRIHSLKAAHSPAKEWPDGLEFYVTSSNEGIELILDLLLTGKYPISSIYKKAVISEISRKVNTHYQEQNGWQFEQVQIEDLLVDKRKADSLPSPTYALRTFTRKGTIKTMVYLTGEFGSIRTYQELQTLSKLLAVTNEASFMQEYLPIHIVLGYLRTVDLTKEYFGFTPPLPIQLVNNEDDEKRGLHLITSYKKEWKKW